MTSSLSSSKLKINDNDVQLGQECGHNNNTINLKMNKEKHFKEYICPCQHQHLQSNIYQHNLENMIGSGELVTTSFGNCKCTQNCDTCLKEKRKPLNIPIINNEDHCHEIHKSHKNFFMNRFIVEPCLRSYKGCIHYHQ
uniref:Uncharacterized protein n=1 Tax=Parastrongyloides trichosuri TaxID=131310 RepID=A0A0N4ZF29_PARTI